MDIATSWMHNDPVYSSNSESSELKEKAVEVTGVTSALLASFSSAASSA